ncbi:MAG: NAD-dependent dehydratase, partial [Actinomycetota bacterium]|nr:NAD-dependent dehydratase [Actinomycetota bacterium]
GTLAGVDMPVSAALTRAATGWEPTGPTLVEDLDAGRYGGTAA